MATSEADERMALARELGLTPYRRQWGTVTAAVRWLRSYAATWDAAAEAQAETELERRAVAVFVQLRPALVATLRELVAVGQSDAQILARPAIHAALERATWHHPRADAPGRKRCDDYAARAGLGS